jgi:predicted Zn finger-like uncharacterized protein
MRIVCPICSATYDVRDELLAPGRAVRCVRCSEQWIAIEAAPQAPPPIAEEPAAPPPPRREPDPVVSPRLTAMDRLASQPVAMPRANPWVRIAWVASFVVLLVAGWGAVAWRGDVMRVWPPSARVYDAVGLAPATPPAH